MPDRAVDAGGPPWPPEDCCPPDEVEDVGAIVTTDDVEDAGMLLGPAMAKMVVPEVVAVPPEIVAAAIVVAADTADA